MIWKHQPNADGGWAYSRGCSWTEPTVLALLAHVAAGVRNDSYYGGLKFLRSVAAPDGGFRPHPAVTESTWVTAAVTLLPEEAIGEPQYRRAIEWLKGQTGRESGLNFRFRHWMSGSKDRYPAAWPWFPGAAAWVIPTAFGILAFERARAMYPDSALDERIQSAQDFLLTRMCADGGWNHGSNRALGKEGDSYPETTGIALLALASASPSRSIEKAKAATAKHLESCRAVEGRAWLTMGLAAHHVAAALNAPAICQTPVEEALITLAAAPINPLRTPLRTPVKRAV
ncbi:MAG TPA: prenyltransferase/squalene oxidase repeat-containing protein [Bryobacteraceae bacterium]|nr:prenyltransferase/squalene oxidase repeat-containing protein [Bryobacteraceae bacterium]